MKQIERIYKYLQDNGSITSLEAFQELGCSRLSGQIFELRKKGHVIRSKKVKVPTRYGFAIVARYYLDS